MSDRKFKKIIIAVIVAGNLLTAAHALYICHAYSNSSIIQFIAREMWL